jgi:hypothetical protein
LIVALAAVLKLSDQLAGWWPTRILGAVELLVAVAILLDRRRLRAWWLAVVLFVVFAAVSGAKAISGAPDCGCFGRVTVSPWLTLAIDLSVLAALMAFCGWRHTRYVSLILVSLGIFALTTGAGDLWGRDDSSLIDPNKWIGQRLPLLDQIDIGDLLLDGRWTVLFYRHGCPACRDLIANLGEEGR